MKTMTQSEIVIANVVKSPLSIQQTAACTWLVDSILAGSLQNAVIEAVAGSGKTLQTARRNRVNLCGIIAAQHCQMSARMKMKALVWSNGYLTVFGLDRHSQLIYIQ